MGEKKGIMKLGFALLLLMNSYGDIQAQCGMNTSVALLTQTDVNNFISNNCTNFQGYLTILDNNDGIDNITDLTPLSTLTSVGERFLIRNNQSLTSLDGLQSLSSVNVANGANGLLLLGNPVLTDISSLTNLTTIGGNLTIQSNNLSSLSGLNNLVSIGGNLSLSNNSLLTDLTSLSNLTSINGYLLINNNALLASLSGLDNIISSTMISQSTGIADINIYDNPLLDYCSVASICNAYSNNNLTTSIMNNATNCDGNLAIITLCATGGTVPVEWSENLVAEVKESNIALRFSTARQDHNSHFEIEHSLDGENYHYIGKILGNGNSNVESSYEFLDRKPSIGKNYYRVKQVDFDGRVEYSKIAVIQFSIKEVKIFPNPAYDEVNVITNGSGELRIYNQLGQMIKFIEVNKELVKVDLSNLKSGIYYLQLGAKFEVLIIE